MVSANPGAVQKIDRVGEHLSIQIDQVGLSSEGRLERSA